MPHKPNHGPDNPDKRDRVLLEIPGRGRFRVLASQVDEFRQAFEAAETEEDYRAVVESAAMSEAGVTRERLRETFPKGVPSRALEPKEGEELVLLGGEAPIPEDEPELALQEPPAATQASVSQAPRPSPLTMVGTDPYNRRYVYDTPAGPQSGYVNPFTAEGGLKQEQAETQEDPLTVFFLSMLAQKARLDRAGNYRVTPKPTALGRTLTNWAEMMPEEVGPFETRDVKTALKGVVGIASVLRTTMEAMGVDFAEPTIEEIAGPGGRPAVESPETARKTGSAAYRDVTEPHVVLSPEEWKKLQEENPAMASLRRTKRLIDSTLRGSFFGPLVEGAIRQDRTLGEMTYTREGAYAKGHLAPPMDETDMMIDVIGHDVLGPLMPSVVAFPAFAAGGRAFGATRLGQAAAGAIGTPARLRAGATLGGAGASGGLGYMLNQMGLVGDPEDPLSTVIPFALAGGGLVGGRTFMKTRLGNTPVSVFTKAFQARAPQFFATVGAEAALGTGYGAAYGGRAAFETGHTEDVAKMALQGALMGGVFGFGFALPFRMRAIQQATRAGRVAERFARDGVLSLKPGDVFNPETGLMFGGTRKNGSIFWQVKDPETGRVRFAKKSEIPDELAIHDWIIEKWINPDKNDMIRTMSTLIDRSPEVEKVKARQHTQAGETPMDTPEKLAITEEMAHLITLREISYMKRAFQQVRAAEVSGRPEAIQAKIDTYKMVAASLDENTQKHILAEVIGRARALERVRARDIPGVSKGTGRFPRDFEGMNSFLAEKAAAEIIDDADPGRLEWIMDLWAVRAKFAGNDRSGGAIRQIYSAMQRQRNAGKVDPAKVREASLAATNERRRLSFKQMRGLQRGSTVLVDGELATVTRISRSTWGRAQVKRGSADPFWVSLEDVEVLPKVNKFGTLRDGTPVKFLNTASDGTSVRVEMPDGSTHFVKLQDIQRAGDHRIANNTNRNAFKEAKAAIRNGTVAPKEPVVDVDPKTVVDRQTGEKLTVEKSNNSQYVARTVTGKRKVVEHADVKDTPTPEAPIDDIWTFSAGTKPSEGRNIVFVKMDSPEASVFAEIMRLYGDRTALLDLVQDAHILAPPTEPGEVLFALELPTTRAGLNASGRKALGVLSGKHKVGNMTRRQWENLLTQPGRTLTPEDLANARIYEVPEGLQHHIRQPDSLFDLSPEDKSTYVSKLTDLSFEVSKDAVLAKQRGNRAAELLESAKKRNRGDEATKAEREIEQARGDVVIAEIKQTEEILDAVRDLQTERIRTTSTIRDTQESNLLRQGETSALRKLIAEHPFSDGRWDNNPLVFEHPDIPGARLVLHKIQTQDASMTARVLVDPTDTTKGVKYVLEEVAEDGRIVRTREISTTSERTPIDVPAVPIEGIKPRVGDVYLAVGKDEVTTVYVNDIRDKNPHQLPGAQGDAQSRVSEDAWERLRMAQEVRQELESGRVIYPGTKRIPVKKPSRRDPEQTVDSYDMTHRTEAEMVQYLKNNGFGKFKDAEILRLLQGKGGGARGEKLRQQLDQAGKEKYDEIMAEIKQLRSYENQSDWIKEEIAELREQLDSLPEQYPAGTRLIQLIDSDTGEGFSNVSEGARRKYTPFFGLQAGDVMPAYVYNSAGKRVRLYRSIDPSHKIERLDVPRTPDELATLSTVAQQLPEDGPAVLISGVPYKTILSPEQVLDRVMNEVSTFDTRANVNLNGNEWRSTVKGLWATIYGTPSGWRVDFWSTSGRLNDPMANPTRIALGGPEITPRTGGKPDQPLIAKISRAEGTGEFVHKRTFNSRKEAENFLLTEGFRKPETPGSKRRVPPKVEAAVDKLHDRINKLVEVLPDNRSAAEVLDNYVMRKGRVVKDEGTGVKSKNLAVEGLSNRQLANLKGQVTKLRNEFIDLLRSEGYDEELIHGALLGSRQSAKDILSRPGEGGLTQTLESLPHWESLTPEDVKPIWTAEGQMIPSDIESVLEKAWMFYAGRNKGYVPPELRNYMFRYAMRRYELLGGDKSPPWSAHIRDNIGYWAEPDIVRRARYDEGIAAHEVFDVLGTDPRPTAAHGTGHVVTDVESAASLSAMELDADAYTVLPGRRILPDRLAGASSEYLEYLSDVKRIHDSIVDRGPLFRKLDDLVDPTDPNTPIEDISVARVKIDGVEELVQITNYDFNNAAVTVMTPEGTFHEVGLNDVSLIRSAKAKFDYVRMSKVAGDEPYFITTSKDIGFDELDQALGVRPGATEVELGRRIAARVRRLVGAEDGDAVTVEMKVSSPADLPDGGDFLASAAALRQASVTPEIRQKYNIPKPEDAPIRFTKKGTMYKATSPALMKELVKLHTRAVEIGRPKEVLSRLPKNARKAFKKLVYDQIVEQRGDAPLTYLEALLKSDQMTPKQLKNLADHAAANGIESSNPIVQLEELIKLNKMHPEIGKLMLAFNKEAGALSLKNKISIPFVDLSRIRRPNDIHSWSVYTASPDYIASRSPSLEIFNNLVWDAQIQENQLFENVVLRQNQEIMDHYGLGGLNEVKNIIAKARNKFTGSGDIEPVRQIKQARELLGEYRTWDAVLENVPDVDPGVKFAFDKFRSMTNELRNYVIQSALRQGRTWVKFGDLDDVVQATVARKFGKTIAEVPSETMVVDNYKHKAARRTKTEANQFIELLEQFDNLESMPDRVRNTVPDWMIKEFDYWKNFGIDNYWPYIHRGKIIVSVVDNQGKYTTLAWARNGAEVMEAIRNALDEGKIKNSTTLVAEPVGYTMDDILTNILHSDDFDRIIRGLMDAAKIEPAQASDILAGANIRPVSGRTTLQNLQMRKQDLASLIPNPLEEMMIYGARVMRNRYLLDVDDAFTWVRTHDRSLSEAFGQAPLKEMPNMSEWFKDAWATAKGEAGYMERTLDKLSLIFDFLGGLPKQVFDDMRENGPGVLANPEIRSKWANSKFYETPYRTRNAANDIAGVQGVLKLGFTPSSAAVNLTQLLINTYPVLGEKYFFSGLHNYSKLRLGKNMDSALKAELTDVLDKTGVKWQRSIASAQTGLGQPGSTAPGVRAILRDMHHPRTAQSSSLAQLANVIEEFGMLGFEGAEQINRSVTAIGAYMKAVAPEAEGGLGLSKGAAIQFAKKTVADTQFLYFDSALPKLLRGPVAKVAMQFKPYLYNQLRFEKNLILAAMRREPEAVSKLVKHFGMLAALGGWRGISKHPFIAPLITLYNLNKGEDFSFGSDPGTMAEAHAEAMTATNGRKPAHWVARDVFNHGLPALAGISIASRVGIAGTDLQFWNDPWSFMLGPTGSMIHQLAQHQRMILGQEGGKEHVAGNLAGAGLAKTIFSMAGKKAPPLSLITAALLTNELQANLVSDVPGRGLAEDPVTQVAPTTEAERLIRNTFPKFLLDYERAGLIWNDALYYDTSGRPIPVPLTGLDHVTAAMAAFTGFQSVDDADRLAWEQMNRSIDTPAQGTRRAFLEAMARAALNEDYARLYELDAQAREMDITITEEQLNVQKRQLTEFRETQIIRGWMNEGFLEYEPIAPTEE